MDTGSSVVDEKYDLGFTRVKKRGSHLVLVEHTQGYQSVVRHPVELLVLGGDFQVVLELVFYLSSLAL